MAAAQSRNVAAERAGAVAIAGGGGRAADVVIAGGGPIGLAVAWRAAARGLRTVVLDAGDRGAWQVAAGMLAPVAEVDFGERPLLELGLRSAERFPAFVDALAEASGRDPGHRTAGTLVVARDADEAAALDRLHAFRRELGLGVERLRPSQARRAEPALAPTVRLALEIAGDHAVDPRRMVAALAEAAERAGAQLRRERVTGIATDGDGSATAADDTGSADQAGSAGRVTGVVLASGETVRARAVVLAAGVGAAALEGLPPEARIPVRPVKGQIMRLRDPRGAGLLERTVRGEQCYLVPRGDGRYVLGATMEERGHDTAPTAGGVYELLRDMSEIVPGVLELEIEELEAGLRPATPDNLPAIGAGALEGLYWAAGHFRNGILNTPVTADLVLAALDGEPLPEWAAAADPLRFAKVAA